MGRFIQAAEAAALIPDGARLLVGGFMGVGSPHQLLTALAGLGRRDLTIITNDTARPGVGVGRLIDVGAVRRVITSHIGTNPETQRRMARGDIEVELVPQGTLIERIRAAGFGLGGVLTPTGVGTLATAGKRLITVDGRDFALETPINADFALVAAKRADHLGNLDYALTARNFNPVIAMAAKTVIAEPGEIVPTGCIPPDAVITPGVLIDHLVTPRANIGEMAHG